MLDVVAGVEQELTLTVESKSFGWLVNLVSAFEVLLRTLSQFSLGGPHDFVQVVHLSEATRGGLVQEAVALHGSHFRLLQTHHARAHHELSG